ncbi:MAG: xanthine dehydrogenase family protein molybdopterin-binding subunit [Burkholderiales bacterium]
MNAPVTPRLDQQAFTHIGTSLPRKEDWRLLTGTARFVDDLHAVGELHACFVRSPHAHARIVSIDSADALKIPGVIAVVTGKELADWTTRLRMAPPIDGLLPTEIETLPTGKVRFQGDPLACVIARDRYVAEDAAEVVRVDYEPLPVIVSMDAATASGAALIDDALGTNRVSHQTFSKGDVEAIKRTAFRVVEASFSQHRQTHLPIETRGCLAEWDEGRQHLTFHISCQVPHPYRTQLAARLRLLETQVTVIVPDIGGGFGQKIALYREELTIAAISRALKRPIRWREDRFENLVASAHAREDLCRTRAAVDANGRLLALELSIAEDFGAYCFYPANYIARVVATILTGPYKVEHYAYDVTTVLTNKCGNAPMRAPMAITSWVMEGTMEAIARALGLDAFEVRRRNMIGAEDQPYTMPTGEVVVDVTPQETMAAALAAIDLDAFRRRQSNARAEGKYLGLGLCNVIESTTYGSAFYKAAGIPGSGHEAAWIRIEPSGVVNASVGLMSSGQSYETPFAQVVAEALGVDPSHVRILTGHTDIAPYGMGSRGSRGGTAGGSVLWLCAQDAKAKVLAIATKLLGIATADDLRLRDAKVEQRTSEGWVATSLTLAQIARTAFLDPLALPAGMPPGLEFVKTYDPPPMTYSNAAHCCIVEVDVTTGHVRIDRYLVADDSGTLINPAIVLGQQHGAVAMGLGGSLFEQVVYDAGGQNLSATLADYLIPTASELPPIEVLHRNTPSHATPIGLKGMAEGGVMGAIGAVSLAVQDALAPFRIIIDRQPLSPENIRARLRKEP